ncbi:MAG TPA: MarR family transcriptional regulator [Alphaproteobacteria bacterium]|jgi:DNA-binding MarR family transcriptional regulator|nr:MarR family transcriptional regulator [Alphaproteobacteria bacterium]MDP6271919.1 MarR family transcriptional regulator [Alphaproteobacteria bacterium]MDP7429062.1 MarR family transcriptional regulator [Alphaproteobacteria bacterium]HJM48399.1 MarR family transcriptional regulator [Alphaproteobacteria bacterium]|tara:strand:+ start:194 stop:622 length:429 start_codon:yes stop_codon:yes gene_type:complete
MAETFREGLVSYLLARASFAVSGPFAAALKEHRITQRQWRILGTLWDSEGMRLGELAAAVMCEQSTATRLVDRLVADGLVDKRPASDDRRKVQLVLTPKGRAETRQLVALSDELERDFAASYGEQNTEALKAELRDLIGRYS